MNILKINELCAKQSILNGLQTIEEVPLNIIQLLVNSDLLNVEPFNNFENEKQQLKKYIKLIKNNKATITYNKSQGIKYGRVNPNKGLGMHCIRREIRHTLLKNIYVDIDIVNCHPNILYQICKQNNIECQFLGQYINNRNICLSEVMNTYNINNEAAKKLFIQILYYGSFESWCNEYNIIDCQPTDFIKNLKNELNIIGELIISDNKKLVKAVRKYRLLKNKNIDNYNEKGSIVSFFIQEYENQILETIYLYCVENGYIVNNNCVLCNDGLMIKKDKYNSELLNIFNSIIKEKMNLDLTFITKELDKGYTLELIKEHQIKDDKDGVFNDLEAAKRVYSLYPHFVYCNGELYVFNDKTGMYSTDETVIFKIINRFENKLHLLSYDKNGEVKISTKSYGNTSILKKH